MKCILHKQVGVHKDDLDFLNINMEDEVASLLSEVATHDVLATPLRPQGHGNQHQPFTKLRTRM